MERPRITFESLAPIDRKKLGLDPVKAFVVGTNPPMRALNKVLNTLGSPTELVEDRETLLRNLSERGGDVVLLFGDDLASIKTITALRNNPEIKDQPAVIWISDNTTANLNETAKKVSNAGADIAIPLLVSVPKIMKFMHSVPEFLAEIEDDYGDKMLKNKENFYKEYKDKLSARSEITADTEKEIKILEEIFEKNGARDILDAGGGEGRIALPLYEDGYKVVNADASEDLLQKMKKKNKNVGAVASDLRDLPLDKGSFDAVTYNWHVFCDILGNKSKRRVLEEAYRVLRPDGTIVLDLPDRDAGEFKKDGVYINYPGGENIFVGYVPSEEEMQRFLEEAGFRDVEVKKWKTGKGFPKVTFTARKYK